VDTGPYCEYCLSGRGQQDSTDHWHQPGRIWLPLVVDLLCGDPTPIVGRISTISIHVNLAALNRQNAQEKAQYPSQDTALSISKLSLFYA